MEVAASRTFVGVLTSRSVNNVLAAFGRGDEVENLLPEELVSEKLESGLGLGGRPSRDKSSRSSIHLCKIDFSTKVIFRHSKLLNDPCFPVRVGPPKNMTGTSY